MNGTVDSVKQNGVLTISVTGMLDAHLVKEFHRCYQDLEMKDKTVIVDCKDTEYMDSAGLGMLLHMKKQLDDSYVQKIKLVNANDRILKLFRLMQFARIFDIAEN